MPVGPAVAPGAGGIAVRWGVIAYVGLLVAMPLAALLASGLGEGVSALWQAVSSPLAADALVTLALLARAETAPGALADFATRLNAHAPRLAAMGIAIPPAT